MNSNKKVFSFKEKLLLGLFVIIVCGFGYYNFSNSMSSKLADLQSQNESLELQLNAVNNKLATFAQMEKELENQGTYMLSYNGASKEIKLLNDIFGSTNEYNIEFTDLTRYGDQIRRSFYFTYRVDSYNTAKSVITKLVNSEYRCLITDVKMVKDSEKGIISVTGNATFYETMRDAIEDAALPVDQKALEEAQSQTETTE